MAIPVSIAGNTGNNSLVINKPSGGWNSGNYLIAIVNNGNTSITPPSGWTLLSSPSVTFLDPFIYGMSLSSAGPSSYTWTGFGAMAGIIGEYAASGLDGSVASNTGSDTTPASWTALTTSQANDYVVLLLAVHNQTATAPTGYTQESSQGGGSNPIVYLFDAQQASAGSTGSPSATLSAADWWAAVTVALKASAGGGSPPDSSGTSIFVSGGG